MSTTYFPLSVKIGSDEVKEFFPNILHRFNFPSDEKDNVLIAVARMLLTPERIKEEKIQFCSTINYASMLTDGKLDKDTVCGDGTVFCAMKQGVWFTFLHDDESEKEIEALKSYESEYKKLSWEPLTDVARYIDNTGKTLVYQNKKRKAVSIITKSANAIKAVHMAASAFSRLFPWYFESVPLTQHETDMLKALFSGDNKTFETFADQYYSEQGFEQQRLIKLISGFCKIDYSDVIERAEYEIQTLRRDITKYYREIQEKQERIERKQVDILVCRNKCTDGKNVENEFIQFVKSNNVVHILGRNEGWLQIGVTCLLDDYDETVFHTYVENGRASNYIYEASPYDRSVTKRFLMAVWKEHRWGLRVYCEWLLDDKCEFRAVRDSNMEENTDLMLNRVPQYHIDRFQCFDGWESAMRACQRERDYMGLTNLFVASSHTLNWGDSTVVCKFMNYIWGHQNEKIFEDKNGTLWTVKEILAQLEKEPEKSEPAKATHKKRERPTAPVTEADDDALAFPA